MRKKLLSLCLLAMCLIVIFVFASCGGNDAKPTESSNGSTNNSDNSTVGSDITANSGNSCQHVEEVIPGFQPTCTEYGLTDGKRCAVCGETTVKPNIIPAGHTYDKGVCSVCNQNEPASEGLEYTLSDDKTYYSVSLGACTDAIIYIPSYYNGLPVTDIEEKAFYGCASLTSVTIPNSVTSIGNYAFDGCANLKYNEYNNAYYLGNEENPYAVLIKAKNKEITECLINENTKVISDNAFYTCRRLTSITIPDSVTSIGDYAFYFCTDSASITIPDSVTSIGDYAFYNCKSLTSITIPDSVTSIGEYAFCRCASLTSLKIPDSITSISECAFDGCTSLTNIIIPDSVKSIGECAFDGCTSLTNITIPDSVTSIGYSAFSYCASLKSITIPNSVTSIGNYAFYECTSLTIYCETESRPSGWNSGWNNSDRPVVWGYTEK